MHAISTVSGIWNAKKKQKNKTKNPEENNNSKFIYIMSGIQMRKMSIQKTHKYYKLKI